MSAGGGEEGGRDRAVGTAGGALQVPAELRDEIVPKNIIMVGPTGVGKTEIARRLARLAQAPFIKVERRSSPRWGTWADVESDDPGPRGGRRPDGPRPRRWNGLPTRRRSPAEERLLDLLLPGSPVKEGEATAGADVGAADTREAVSRHASRGKLSERTVEVEFQEAASPVSTCGTRGRPPEGMEGNLQEMLSGLFPKRTRRKRCGFAEAARFLEKERPPPGRPRRREAEWRSSAPSSRDRFSRRDRTDRRPRIAPGPHVSRQGVQRTCCRSSRGRRPNEARRRADRPTSCSSPRGAFHVTSRPTSSGAAGRFPSGWSCRPLSGRFVRILTEPHARSRASTRPMLSARGSGSRSRPSGAADRRDGVRVNDRTENIGARRLHTVMERLLTTSCSRLRDLRAARWSSPAYVERGAAKRGS